jgi:hypothetical protein
VNGDGSLDLISASDYYDTITVLTNDGGGGFALSSKIMSSADFSPRSVVAVDLNGDGNVDLAFVNFNDFYTPGTLTVMTNNGAGGFAISPAPYVGDGPNCIVAADVNGDGNPDLITANHLGNTLSVLINVPKLTGDWSTNGLTVSWPSLFEKWMLEKSSDVTATNWSVANGVAGDGTNESLTISTSAGSSFFRLVYP